MNWSTRPDKKFRLALGSFLEDYTNKVNIVRLNEESGEFEETTFFDHPYPATKLMWIPDRYGTLPDYMATTGDYLRLWQVNSDTEVKLKACFNNVRALVG